MASEQPPPLAPDARFMLATVGGTFNAMHLGHRRYIELAAAMARRVVVFVATDRYVADSKPYAVRPFPERFAKLEAVVQSIAGGRGEVRPLDSDDEFIAEAVHAPFDLAVVEPAYVGEFLRLNELRRSRGNPEIYILIKPRTMLGGTDIASRSG